jgi:dipeptidyl-peptidase-4
LSEPNSDELREIAETAGYTQGFPQRITLTPAGGAVLFLRSGPRDREASLWCFDVESGKTRELASAESLLGGKSETLTPEEKARRERQRIVGNGITTFEISGDGAQVLVPISGELFLVERSTGAARALAGIRGATDAKFSPDGRFVSFVRDHDLHVCEWRTGAQHAVTTGGTAEISHGEAEFVAQEEMGRFSGYAWSPDSTRLAWEESDVRLVPRAYISDPARPDRAPESFPYPFAGKTNATVRLALSHVGAAAKPVFVEWDREKFPYLARLKWEKSGQLAILVQSRRQRDEILYAVDPGTGGVRELLRDHDDAWLELAPDTPRWLERDGSFLWKTQADGEWRLALHDREGARLRVLNPGNEFRLRNVLHVDEARGMVIVSGAADAPESHVWELALDRDAPPKQLTTGTGMHERVYATHTAAHAFVQIDASLHSVATARVRVSDGRDAGLLPSIAATPARLPNVERTKIAGFDATIVRPHDFKSGRKYPVIVFVYGGPSEGVVHETLAGTWIWRQQWFADQGFVVVASDNRGVALRGRAWETALLGDFGGVTLDDQAAALAALGARHPEIDLAHAGITGWSYGGYLSALAVTKRPDVFHAAAAGAPVVDWADYDTHYTERFIGLPQDEPENYRKSNVTTWAAGLSRPLLLVHATADDNVYFSHSLKLADALYRAGKPFELVAIAGETHMAIRLPEHAARIDARIAEFFRRALWSET